MRESTENGAAETTAAEDSNRRGVLAISQRTAGETQPSTRRSARKSTEATTKRHRFRSWRRRRPFVGSVLVILGGIELFFSGQLDTGNLHIQFGIEGLQATVIPIAIVVLGLCAMLRPTHYLFYGIIALVLSVYSLIGVNLGGFLLGMLLATIGAILVVAWMGPRKPKSETRKPKSERRGDSGPTDEGESA